jgi:hypothetical protein
MQSTISSRRFTVRDVYGLAMSKPETGVQVGMAVLRRVSGLRSVVAASL